MGDHMTGLSLMVLGFGAAVVGGWAFTDGRRWSHGPAAMLAVAVVGIGLVLLGAASIVSAPWLAKALTWVGVGIAALGGVAYAVNPRIFGRE